MANTGMRLGLAVIVFGLVLDLVGHGFADMASAHLGHLVVVLGMVLTLAGVVVDGTRGSGRRVRAAKEVRHALR